MILQSRLQRLGCDWHRIEKSGIMESYPAVGGQMLMMVMIIPSENVKIIQRESRYNSLKYVTNNSKREKELREIINLLYLKFVVPTVNFCFVCFCLYMYLTEMDGTKLPLQIAISHWKLTCEESGNLNMEAITSSAAPFSLLTVTECCFTGHLEITKYRNIKYLISLLTCLECMILQELLRPKMVRGGTRTMPPAARRMAEYGQGYGRSNIMVVYGECRLS